MAKTFNKAAFFSYLFDAELYADPQSEKRLSVKSKPEEKSSGTEKSDSPEFADSRSAQIYGLFTASTAPSAVYGKFTNGLLILCRYEGMDSFSKEDQQLLQKVLSSIQVQLADSALVIFGDDGICKLNDSVNEHLKYVLCFGDFEESLKHLNQSIPIIRSCNLKKLADDVNEKRRLWASLKDLFKL